MVKAARETALRNDDNEHPLPVEHCEYEMVAKLELNPPLSWATMTGTLMPVPEGRVQRSTWSGCVASCVV